MGGPWAGIRIEKERGLVKRSAFIVDILDKGLTHR